MLIHRSVVQFASKMNHQPQTDLFQPEGFDDVVDRAAQQALHPLVRHARACQEDHGDLPGQCRGLHHSTTGQAIANRHQHIHQHDVRIDQLNLLECILAVACQIHAATLLLQVVGEQHPLIVDIIDDRDTLPLENVWRKI